RAAGRPVLRLDCEVLAKTLVSLAEQNPVLRALGPGDAWLHAAKDQFQPVAVLRRLCTLVAPDALFLRVCLDQADLRGFASRELEIANGFAVDREDRAGAAELRRHVAKGGPIRKWQIREPVAEKFDELADGTFPAQHFRHGKHEVGSGSALPQSAAQLEAENLRYQQRDRLAQHRGFGLDAANTPAQYPKPVNHGGVRVRAHQRIGISGTRAVLRHVEYDPAKVLKVD